VQPLRQLGLASHLARARGIGRRYFVVNGFDGALTMLGLITGFELGGEVALPVVTSACLGAAIALAISGLTSAYLSESAERRRSLSELEGAMVTDLSASAHGIEARVVPLLVALTNGAAPLLVSVIIITPLWLAQAGASLPLPPLRAAIATALVCIFGLGAFLGRVGGTSWLWNGIKTVLIAVATMLVIRLFEVGA
jgi:predicted membrane protein (TIGR00267 family)